MQPSFKSCEDSGWSLVRTDKWSFPFLSAVWGGGALYQKLRGWFIQVKDFTGNTCLVALMAMCFQKKKMLCGFMFFQLAKITCWMDFSNLVFTRQRRVQFLSLLGHRIARSSFSNWIYKCRSLLVSYRRTEIRTSYWCEPVTPTGIPIGSQRFRPKGWKEMWFLHLTKQLAVKLWEYCLNWNPDYK